MLWDIRIRKMVPSRDGKFSCYRHNHGNLLEGLAKITRGQHHLLIFLEIMQRARTLMQIDDYIKVDADKSNP
ncbi:MAG: hypothetical protein ABFS02_06075 [Pseudomonadota bacterium]